MADNIPTFHHLNNSQSQRILWLLEELSIPYKLVLHTRDLTTHLAPPSLSALGPTGKAPLLVTSDGRQIPESSAIATYLIKTYDTSDKFGHQSGDWIRDEILLSMMLTNLGPNNKMKLMLDFQGIANGKGPWGKMFDGPALRKSLAEMQHELETGPEGGYLMGKKLGRCDVMFEWPLAMITQRNYVDLEKEFPKLWEWLQRVYARPAWKRGLEKGNGYDLRSFPMKEHLDAKE